MLPLLSASLSAPLSVPLSPGRSMEQIGLDTSSAAAAVGTAAAFTAVAAAASGASLCSSSNRCGVCTDSPGATAFVELVRLRPGCKPHRLCPMLGTSQPSVPQTYISVMRSGEKKRNGRSQPSMQIWMPRTARL